MARRKKEDIRRAIEVFHEVLDSGQIADRLGITPLKARKLWAEAKKYLVTQKMTPGAAHEFAAETDEILHAIEMQTTPHLTAYDAVRDKLTGLAALVKQLTELRKVRLQIRQDMGLLGAITKTAGRTAAVSITTQAAPAPVASAQPQEPEPEMTIADLEEYITVLGRDLEHKRAALASEPVLLKRRAVS